tara:strand:+ start:594 stop:1124 length:531 start_codon:yes stop_codon:yes gene_type:complete
MSNLRLIKETSFSDVTALDMTDVFTTDFNVYKVVATGYDETSGDANRANIRFIDSSGSIDSSSSYRHASLAMEAAASGSFPTVSSNSADHINFVLYDNGQTGACSSAVWYIYSPSDSSSYTFMTFHESHFQQGYGSSVEQGVGVYYQTSTVSGFRLYSSASGNFDVKVTVYGIGVD